MSDTKHTPGPWVTYPEMPRDVCAGNRELLATAYPMGCDDHMGSDDDMVVAKANASLIAAAPDLLHALVSLLALAEGECPSLLEDDHHYELVTSAIAKAEGRV